MSINDQGGWKQILTTNEGTFVTGTNLILLLARIDAICNNEYIFLQACSPCFSSQIFFDSC